QPCRSINGVGLDLQALDKRISDVPPPGIIDQAKAPQPRQQWQREVVLDRVIEDESLRSAVLRNERDTSLDGVIRLADGCLPAPDHHLSSLNCIDPEEGPCQCGAAAAHQPGDPENLPRIEVEGDIANA